FSSFLLVPYATTFPSCLFSSAVSGLLIPPFFTSCSSSVCTSTRSPSGFTLTVAISYLPPVGFCCYARSHFFQNGYRQIFPLVKVAARCDLGSARVSRVGCGVAPQ